MMKYIAIPALLSAACIDPAEPELGFTEQAAVPQCEDWGCGINSPRVDDNFFHEINFDGAVNSEGYYMTGAQKGTALYDLSLENNRLVARFTVGTAGSPSTLRGSSLVGLKVKIYIDGSERTLEIVEVATSARFIADGSWFIPPAIETYRFKVWVQTPQGWTLGADLCPLAATTGGTGAVPEHHSLLFAGERVNGQTKVITSASSRWVTIGCEGSALAKMHLYGHTAAASAYFTNTLSQRQTFLRAVTADYCGTGRVFTVAGQPLEFSSDDGTIQITPGVTTTIEARWDATGAICLNTPRLEANPPGAFSYDVDADIAAECTRPPPCFGTTRAHITTHNPN